MTSLTFSVVGMTCADCSERLEVLLKADSAVAEATVLLMAGLAKVKAVGPLAPLDVARLCGYGSSLGFTMALQDQSGGELCVDIVDGTCDQQQVEALRALNGVRSLTATSCTASRQLNAFKIAYAPAVIGSRHLLGFLRRTPGVVHLEPCEHGAAGGGKGAQPQNRWRLGTALAIALASILISYATPHPTGAYDEPISADLTPRILAAGLLATLAMLLYFPRLFSAAWGAAAISGMVTMDTLVCLSSGTAYVFSLAILLAGRVESFGEPPFEATSVLLSLVALARELDQQAKQLTQRALASLSSLQKVPALLEAAAPCGSRGAQAQGDCGVCKDGEGAGAGPWQPLAEAVVVVRSPSEAPTPSSLSAAQPPPPPPPPPAPAPLALKHLPYSLLHLQDIVRVKPGALFPADGRVVHGSTTANEALVTGEPLPVSKTPGSSVIGGTTNGVGEVGVQVALLPTTGTISRILALIEDAQAHRPLVQGTANAIAAYFTPAVVVLSLGTLAGWWAAAAAGRVDTRGVSPPAFALQFALSLLVVSCPCVVALAVAPVTYAATTVAARRGLLVKGGAALETGASIDTVVFDKTGCLTTGKGGVKALVLCDAGALEDAALCMGLKELPRVPPGGPPSRAKAGAAAGPSPAPHTTTSAAALEEVVPPLCPLCLAPPPSSTALSLATPPAAASAAAPAAPAVDLPPLCCSRGGSHQGLGRVAPSTRELQLLGIAALVCEGTTHPLSSSICAAAERVGLPPIPAPTLPCGMPAFSRSSLPGRGILITPLAAGASGESVALGSPEWIGELLLPPTTTAPPAAAAAAAGGEGGEKGGGGCGGGAARPLCSLCGLCGGRGWRCRCSAA